MLVLMDSLDRLQGATGLFEFGQNIVSREHLVRLIRTKSFGISGAFLSSNGGTCALYTVLSRHSDFYE
jgi:hypothetical protein